MSTHLDEPYLSIHWDESARCVRMEWKAFAKSNEFRQGLNKGLNLLVIKKANCWLADLRKMGALSLEDQQWSDEDWFPRAVQCGVRYLAIVMPESALASIGVRNIMKNVGDIAIETRYFDNVEQAHEWLKSH